MNVVYVLNNEGSPLMPTKRFGKVRRMLKEGQAKVVNRKPFTIQILNETTNYTQNLTLGLDTGRTNISITVSNEYTGECLFSSELTTRNKEIPKLILKRKMHRQFRRRNRRLKKVRIAKKNNTVYKNVKNVVHKGAKNSIPVKFMKNKIAKFNYRVRPDGWLTPTARHLKETHLNYLDKVVKILPIRKYIIEYGEFDIQKLDNSEISGKQYQQGTLSGFDRLEDFLYYTQDGKCLMCSNKIKHYHHIIPQSKNGADTHHNIAGLCGRCHEKVHNEIKYEEKIIELKEGTKKRYDSTSILNTIMPSLFTEIQDRYGEYKVFRVYGYETKEIRFKLNLTKTHYNDSYVISLYYSDLDKLVINQKIKPYYIKQFRRHNRQKLCATKERVYKIDGKTVAKNRNKRTDQNDDSLREFKEKMYKNHSKKEVRIMISKITVVKNSHNYQTKKIFKPGNEVMYRGKRYIVKGNTSRATYLILYDYILKENETPKNIPAKNVKIINKKTGIVFM